MHQKCVGQNPHAFRAKRTRIPTADAGHWNSDCPLLKKNGGHIELPTDKPAPAAPAAGSAKMSRAAELPATFSCAARA